MLPIIFTVLFLSRYTCGCRPDAHVGARAAVPARPGLAPRRAAGGDAPAAVLLLRAGVPEPRGPPSCAAAQGLPDPADPLPAQALRAALPLPPLRQGPRRARGLAHAREELRPPMALHLRLRLQAQALAQGPCPRVRARPCRGASIGRRRRQQPRWSRRGPGSWRSDVAGLTTAAAARLFF
jgi:hypothetical protein